ncbi:MAG: hypothetical protein QOF14_2166 [Hyphomicrobiales bacterium]|nr:hypothetical protein [Hyphomicrobiales bacterium]
MRARHAKKARRRKSSSRRTAQPKRRNHRKARNARARDRRRLNGPRRRLPLRVRVGIAPRSSKPKSNTSFDAQIDDWRRTRLMSAYPDGFADRNSDDKDDKPDLDTSQRGLVESTLIVLVNVLFGSWELGRYATQFDNFGSLVQRSHENRFEAFGVSFALVLLLWSVFYLVRVFLAGLKK